MGAELKPGDRVIIKAALYSPSDDDGGTRYIMNGQIYTVTEDDLKRSDADLIFEPADPALLEVVDTPDAEQDLKADEVAVDLTSPSYAELEAQLKGMTLRQAKAFLGRDGWTAEGLLVARDAEEAGKDREPVLTYIDGKIGQLPEEPVEGSQV